MAVMMLSLQSQNFPEEILQSDPFKVWKPVQYTLEWDIIPNARYRLFSCGQGMNDNYWTKNTNGVWSSVVLTNNDFSPFYPVRSVPNELGPMVTWTNDTGIVETFRAPPTNAWSFDFTTNRTMVLQGKSQAGVKWYVVAVLNSTNMYRTSNITGWPTNWNTVSTNNFSIRLNRMPIGPPMYINPNPPKRPQATTGATQ
jgi:hypothetical protein